MKIRTEIQSSDLFEFCDYYIKNVNEDEAIHVTLSVTTTDSKTKYCFIANTVDSDEFKASFEEGEDYKEFAEMDFNFLYSEEITIESDSNVTAQDSQVYASIDEAKSAMTDYFKQVIKRLNNADIERIELYNTDANLKAVLVEIEEQVANLMKNAKN